MVFACGCNLAWGIREVPAPLDAVPLTCEQLTSHNEDGDTALDGCDVCPGISDDQKDTDMDGVGDACDPDGSSAQHIAYFESFGEADASMHWTVQGGPWSFHDDAAVYTSTGDLFSDVLAKTMVAPPYTLEATFSIDAIDPQGSVLQVVGDSTVMCGIIRHTSSSTIDDIRMEADNGNTNEEVPFLVLMNGERLRITMTYRTSGMSNCTVTELSSGTSASVQLMVGPQTPGLIGVHDLAIPTHFEYMAVYAPVP